MKKKNKFFKYKRCKIYMPFQWYDEIDNALSDLIDLVDLGHGTYTLWDLMRIARKKGIAETSESYGIISREFDPDNGFQCESYSYRGERFKIPTHQKRIWFGTGKAGRWSSIYLTAKTYPGSYMIVSIIDKDTEFNSGMFIDSGICLDGDDICIYTFSEGHRKVIKIIAGTYHIYRFEDLIILKEGDDFNDNILNRND